MLLLQKSLTKQWFCVQPAEGIYVPTLGQSQSAMHFHIFFLEALSLISIRKYAGPLWNTNIPWPNRIVLLHTSHSWCSITHPITHNPKSQPDLWNWGLPPGFTLVISCESDDCTRFSHTAHEKGSTVVGKCWFKPHFNLKWAKEKCWV